MGLIEGSVTFEVNDIEWKVFLVFKAFWNVTENETERQLV